MFKDLCVGLTYGQIFSRYVTIIAHLVPTCAAGGKLPLPARKKQLLLTMFEKEEKIV